MAELDPTASTGSGQSRQHQLPLEIRLRDDATLDNYFPLPAVEPLVSALQNQMQAQGEAALYLYGPSGAGKSHLLQASCQAVGSRGLYLPLSELREYPAADVLQGVAHLDLVCLDDLQSVLGDANWELALFNFYNLAMDHGCRIVLAADAAPRALSVGLEDLRSRLAWAVVYQLPQGNDEEKAAIIQFRAARRGLSMPPAVAAYIVSRAPRAMDRLLEVLEVLDRASIAEQRALSIPFVKGALGW